MFAWGYGQFDTLSPLCILELYVTFSCDIQLLLYMAFSIWHFVCAQEMTELQDLLEGCEEEGDMKALAREEQKGCYQEMQHMQRSILGALVPKDSADKHSAILEVRAGKLGGVA